MFSRLALRHLHSTIKVHQQNIYSNALLQIKFKGGSRSSDRKKEAMKASDMMFGSYYF